MSIVESIVKHLLQETTSAPSCPHRGQSSVFVAENVFLPVTTDTQRPDEAAPESTYLLLWGAREDGVGHTVGKERLLSCAKASPPGTGCALLMISSVPS